MYGTLQVIDVSDIEHPRSVAWYTPEKGGVHNVWQAGDTLYIGAYDAGFHVFDISGELKGDLRAQQREMASLNTADMSGNMKNAAFDWGVVVNPKDGLAYVNDFNNGLWVVRVNPKRRSSEPRGHPMIALLAALALAGQPAPVRPTATTSCSWRARETTGSRWCGSARLVRGSSAQRRSASTPPSWSGRTGYRCAPTAGGTT